MEQAKAEGNLGGVLQAIDRVQKVTALLATLLATLLDKLAPEASIALSVRRKRVC